eukprot:TRINITY_DN23546_c0_g1_i1.p1 TRINITY_DN23546_c0_g1~~TRINITY_DN23546_c0_g1_i1.p1  ORF type:complete len:1230 (+),score=197.98 TRINITY_DN23546_c0_g1_i1:58-3690(+)
MLDAGTMLISPNFVGRLLFLLISCGSLALGFKILKARAPCTAADDASNISLYNLCTFLQPPTGGWISAFDCTGRATRCVYAFYYLLLSRPSELFYFLAEYHKLHHFGGRSHWVLAACLPAWPVMVLVYTLYQRLRSLRSKGAVNVFFTEPRNLIARVAFAFVMEASVPLAIFMVHGNNMDALRGSFHDYVCTKPFWRKHMQSVGMKVPLCLGTWGGERCVWENRAVGQRDDYRMGDLVLKIPDGCLGRGDTFLETGKEGYDGSLAAARAVLEEKYKGIDGVLVLEWIRPASSCEVHSFDICTLVRPDGIVELVSCLYWGGCGKGSSTHDATVGFVCDVQNHRLMATTSWYSACFAESMPTLKKEGTTPDIGTSFPGLQEMCLAAVRAHGAVLAEQPWLRMVGWDAMLTDEGPVFFEGNYASHRMPRRAFLTWQLTRKFLEMSQQYTQIVSPGNCDSVLGAVVSPISALNGHAPLPLAAPESVGVSSERLTQISRWSDGWVSSLKMPGLITAVARHGKLCYVHSSGWADDERQVLLGTRTIVRIYSMTKPVVSVAVMRMYERGLFQLDEPISRFLPSFSRPKVLNENGEAEAAGREITFLDLLTHTSGIGYNDDDEDGPMSRAYEHAGAHEPDSLTLADFVDRLGTLPLHFEPGTSWRYGYSTDVLGRLLEILSGLSLDEVLEREVFAPMIMTDTAFVVPKEKEHRFAAIYQVDDEDDKTKETKEESQRFERFDNCVSIVRVSSADTKKSTVGGPEPTGVTTALLSLASTENTSFPDRVPHLAILAGKPVLEHVFNQLVNSGIRRIVLVIAGQTDFYDLVTAMPCVADKQLEVNFVDLGEDYTGGWARSLLLAQSALGNGHFLLCTSDHIYDTSLIRRLATCPLAASCDRRGFDAVALVEEVFTSDALPREVVRVQLRQQQDGSHRVSAIGGSDHGLRADAIEAGMYVCSQSIFEAMCRMGDRQFQLAECMQLLAEKKRLGCATTAGEVWFRCKVAKHHGRQRGRKHGSYLTKTSPSWEMRLSTKADYEPAAFIGRDAIAVAKSAKCFKVCEESYCGSYGVRPLNLSGGSGLVSTMHDYCLFAQMLLNGGELRGVRILSRKTVEYMRNNFLPLSHTGRRQDIAAIATDSGFSETSFDGIGFGIGWSVMTDPVKAAILTSKNEHGWGGWASTFFAVDPTEDLFVVFMAQLIPSDRYPLRRQLRCLLSQTLIS